MQSGYDETEARKSEERRQQYLNAPTMLNNKSGDTSFTVPVSRKQKRRMIQSLEFQNKDNQSENQGAVDSVNFNALSHDQLNQLKSDDDNQIEKDNQQEQITGEKSNLDPNKTQFSSKTPDNQFQYLSNYFPSNV